MRIEGLDEGDSPVATRQREVTDDLGQCATGPPDVLQESGDREAYYERYRALVEAEYRATGESCDANPPALRHADADPLRTFGPASETHPDERRWRSAAASDRSDQ